MSPHRIRLRRNAGWRKPPGAVVVARGPGRRWGNPVDWRHYPATLSEAERRRRAVEEFRTGLELGAANYPSLDEIRAELAGRDLCCWCPSDQPCHADVLLELANPRGHDPRPTTTAEVWPGGVTLTNDGRVRVPAASLDGAGVAQLVASVRAALACSVERHGAPWCRVGAWPVAHRVRVLGSDLHPHETQCGVWIRADVGDPTAADDDQRRCRRCLTVQGRGYRPYFPPDERGRPGDLIVDLDQ